MKLVEFQPVNPPSLHSAFIGGIDVFGVTRALPIPLPTTIAGAIGSYLNIYLTSSDPVDALVELYNAISAKLNCRDLACIRGPLVYFEVDDRRIGPYVSIEDYFTQLDSIRVYGSSVVCVEDTGEIVEWNPRVRVGVALERRGVKGDKRVIPGYFYKYVVSTYRLGSRIVNPVFTYITPLTIEHSVLLRLGGEGSVAVVKSRDVDYLDRVVERVTSPLGELEEGYYIALSPIPLLPRKSIVESWRDLETPLNPEYSEVLGIPMKCPSTQREAIQPPKLRVTRIGLGYSEASGKRRPQILALLPGTLVKINKKHRANTNNLLLKTLLNLGFATLYKLKL